MSDDGWSSDWDALKAAGGFQAAMRAKEREEREAEEARVQALAALCRGLMRLVEDGYAEALYSHPIAGPDGSDDDWSSSGAHANLEKCRAKYKELMGDE